MRETYHALDGSLTPLSFPLVLSATCMSSMLSYVPLPLCLIQFQCFSKNIRPAILEQHPGSSVTEVAKLVGQKWKELSEDGTLSLVSPCAQKGTRHPFYARREVVCGSTLSTSSSARFLASNRQGAISGHGRAGQEALRKRNERLRAHSRLREGHQAPVRARAYAEGLLKRQGGSKS